MDLPPIRRLAPVTLLPFLALENARPRLALFGMWTCYIASLELKLLHSSGGFVHSIARSAPRREEVGGPRDPEGHWARAFATPVTRRVAENWVMHDRLFRAGLGPEPQALAIAPRYRAWFSGGVTVSAGIHLANLRRYPPKPPATEGEVRAAGVILDANRAALREQMRGYVLDLNAVRGAMPENAEAEVAALTAALDAALARARA